MSTDGFMTAAWEGAVIIEIEGPYRGGPAGKLEELVVPFVRDGNEISGNEPGLAISTSVMGHSGG